MADYFQQQPNFSNPSYVTPEQLANARAYAAALMKRGPEGATRPTGAAAAVIDALTGTLERKRADELQSEAAARNAGRQGAMFDQLQRGQPINPRNAAEVFSDPMASPESRELVSQLVKPQGTKDVYNRPAFASPMQGVQAAPIRGVFEPGFQSPDTVPGASATQPVIAPNVQRAPVASSPRWYGDNEAVSKGLYPPAVGGSAGPGAVPTPASGPAPSRLDALFQKGQDFERQAAINKAGAGAGGEIVREDIAGANEAPNILKGVGIIRDNIARFGDRITFGPTSEWSLEMKRAAANYAPGFMRDQLEAVAAADSINKVGIQLAGTLSKQIGSGTQGEFFKSLQGVPGLLTSRQGALAMADMVEQAAKKQQQLGLILQNPNHWQNYAQLKQEFYRNNPIINPLTGNPIELDATQRGNSAGGGGGARIISVEPAR